MSKQLPKNQSIRQIDRLAVQFDVSVNAKCAVKVDPIEKWKKKEQEINFFQSTVSDDSKPAAKDRERA